MAGDAESLARVRIVATDLYDEQGAARGIQVEIYLPSDIIWK